MNSEEVGNVPQVSENFGTILQASERSGLTRKASERKESHTLTVREVARMFEQAGVARTERSITNWCQPNKLGVPRLDCYFDPNEHKYFISPHSVGLAIKEEIAKAAAANRGDSRNSSRSVPNDSHDAAAAHNDPQNDPEPVKALKQELLDLKIMNRAKDMFIERLQEERKALAEEQRRYVERMIGFSRQIGELRTRLLQLGSADDTRATPLDVLPGRENSDFGIAADDLGSEGRRAAFDGSLDVGEK